MKGDAIALARDGQCAFRIQTYDRPGIVVQNAVQMFRDELREKHGIGATDAASAGHTIVIRQPEAGGDDDQTFTLRTHRTGDAWQVTVAGTGERAILYGLCELLDRAFPADGAVCVPVMNMESSPHIKKRGTERHWGPELHTPEGAAANIELIRALARRRVNQLLWIDGWVQPGWYRFLDFRHYPKLARADADGRVQQAKTCLRQVVREAKRWGMEFYLSTTELTVPERLLTLSPGIFHTNAAGFPVLRFDHPETWLFYRARIREIMEDIPELSGVELWTAEAMDPAICHVERQEEWPLTKRLLHVANQTLQAMDEAGRSDGRVIFATFIHHPDGERAFEPLCGRLPERCDGRMKMQVEDYYRFHAPTTLAGKISPGREWVEFDPAGEHRGDWIGWITVHLRYIHERMSHYYDRGVRHFLCRVRGFSSGPHAGFVGDYAALHGVQSIKCDAFFKWCWDMNLSIDDVWRQCKPAGYPDEMLEFYLLSEQVSDQTQNVGQCLVNNNHASFLGSVEHYEMKMRLIDVYGNADCQARRWILEPSEQNLALIVREKEEAVACAERMQVVLTSCRDRLPVDDYALLQRTMDYQLACVRVWRFHTEAYFRYRLYALNKPGGEYDKLMAAVQQCEVEIRKLRAHDEQQADSAHALMGSIRSLAWVAACSRQMTPKGIIPGV